MNVFERIGNWIGIEEGNMWDMGELVGLDVMKEMKVEEIVRFVKEMEEDLKVLKKVVDEVEGVRRIYMDEMYGRYCKDMDEMLEEME